MADTNGRKPDWVIRAKQDASSDYWSTIGVGWSFKDGKEGVSIRLHTIPVGWSGEMLLMRPLEQEEAPAPEKGKAKK